jgi:DHA1 family bicyclomycin/chloramphenicol resistance-like MFS transporter
MATTDIKVRKSRLILLLGGLAALGPLSIDMYLPSFPAVQNDLQTSAAAVSATVATFFVGLCLGQMIYGPLSDKIGRRKPLLLGLAIYLTASLGCMLATSIEALLVLRFLQALGACSGMVVGRAMIRDLFPPEETARVLSMVILTMGVAPILAPLLGQMVADLAGWRGNFAFMALFALGLGMAVLRVLRQDATLVRPAAAPLWQRFASVLQDRTFVAYALSGTLIQGGLYAYITGSSSLFMEDLGLSPKAFSILFGVNASGLILASQLNNWLLRRYSYQRVLEGSLRVAAPAAVVLAGMGLTHSGGLAITVPLFIFIASLGLVFPNSTAGALAGQGHQAGTASAVLGVVQYGGAALASAAVGALHHFTSAPLQVTMGLCGVLSLLAFSQLIGGSDGPGRPTYSPALAACSR